MINVLRKIGSLFTNLRIPTFLGLGILLLGLGAGVFLVVQNQTLISLASPAQEPTNITIASITDQSVAISWQTTSPVTGFLNFGPGGNLNQTALDVRDTTETSTRTDHYVLINNLVPQTSYQFKIISGKLTSPPQKFTTAQSASSQNSLPPIIGSVLDGINPINEGVVYLNITGGATQSAPISTLGSFTITLTEVYKDDLSDILPLSENTLVTLKIISGGKISTSTLTLKIAQTPLPPIKLGGDVVFTTPAPTPTPQPPTNIYDLNNDSQVNSSDYAIAIKNLGKKIKTIRKDLNIEDIIDQKYLDAMIQKIKSSNQ
ncbi:MAG: fibronectin type III domain-containing protein [Candidatus Daviesbacteria bacterium]|nr:fibronectin type III domain-containing protein [Candidatus Daviesbacteria bacterium]